MTSESEIVIEKNPAQDTDIIDPQLCREMADAIELSRREETIKGTLAPQCPLAWSVLSPVSCGVHETVSCFVASSGSPPRVLLISPKLSIVAKTASRSHTRFSRAVPSPCVASLMARHAAS